MSKPRTGGLQGLPIYDRRGYWICYVRDRDGNRRQRALHIRNDGTGASQRAAVAAYWVEQARATAGQDDRRKPAHTLAKALMALRALQEAEGLTVHALDRTLYRSARLLRHYGPDYDIAQITSRAQLVEYVEQARDGRSNGTMLIELGVLLQAMAVVGLPTPRRPKLPARPKPQQPLSDEEVRRVLLAATPQHYLTMLAYLTLGVRLSEIRKIESVNWDAQELYIAGTKTAKAQRTLPIPDELYEEMLRLRRAGEWRGFPKLTNARYDQIIRSTCIRAGIGARSANDLRGTVSQRLRRAGVDAEMRGAFQGNSARMQEQTYTQANTLTDAMRAAVQKTKRITRKGDTGS